VNKKTIKLILKLTLTGLAIFLVFRKIDSKELLSILITAKWTWLFGALLLFILSKFLTALRLNAYFRNIGLYISEIHNIKLYSIGMFYNLFLPGGIGGDGYKVYMLNKHHGTPLKPLLQSVLLDRLGGLVAIIFLLFGLVLLVKIDFPLLNDFPLETLSFIGLILVFPVFLLVQKLMFKKFLPSFLLANLYSIMGQVVQLVCAYCILASLGIYENTLEYQFVFLVSSIIAVLPLTIGGVGARELVFIFSHEYVGIDKNAAVAFSLIFFLISAIVSLMGAFPKSGFHKD